MKLPKKLRDIKINIQMWNFRRKYKSGEKVDLDKQIEAIKKAEGLCIKRKCRLWVIRVMPGKYLIRSKGDVKALFKAYGIKHTVDMFQLSDVIVHITK
jgi:hypothetical protein